VFIAKGWDKPRPETFVVIAKGGDKPRPYIDLQPGAGFIYRKTNPFLLAGSFGTQHRIVRD